MAVCAVRQANASSALVNRTFRLGSIYIITGHTGTASAGATQHILGPVTLRGSWDGGPWQVLAGTEAKGRTGSYRIVVRPRHRGVLHLRLATPDPGLYNVVLTVV